MIRSIFLILSYLPRIYCFKSYIICKVYNICYFQLQRVLWLVLETRAIMKENAQLMEIIEYLVLVHTTQVVYGCFNQIIISFNIVHNFSFKLTFNFNVNLSRIDPDLIMPIISSQLSFQPPYINSLLSVNDMKRVFYNTWLIFSWLMFGYLPKIALVVVDLKRLFPTSSSYKRCCCKVAEITK